MRLLHSLAQDPRIVRRPESRVARRAGPGDGPGAARRPDGSGRGARPPGGECGVNAYLKVGCLVAGMAAGADSIDDMDLLRHGAMDALFGGVRAPSTLGSHLRSYTWGNVTQLEKAGREFLAELARQAPLLPGAGTLAFIDIDSMQKRVYGHQKQGARFGHTKIQGKSLLVRGLNALAAVISTPIAAPVIAATRLRGGNAASARGAASLAVQAVGTARAVRLHRHDHRPDGLGLLQRRGHRRGPPPRRAVLRHRPDERQHPRRHRRHRRRRLDRHPVPARDLGRPAGLLDLRRRGRRDRVHGLRVEEGPGRHRPADRPPGPRPEQQGRRRAGRAVPRLALPRGLHRLAIRAGPGRGAAPRPCGRGAVLRRRHQRPARSYALGYL